jgi:hypothetical protein
VTQRRSQEIFVLTFSGIIMGEVKKLDTLMWGVGKVLKDKNNLFEEK